MMERRVTVAIFGLHMVLCSVVGCSPAGPVTYEVGGSVSNKGEPLKFKRAGEQKIGGIKIWLVKQDVPEPAERKYAILLDDGKFVFDGDNKPTAGKFRVCVVWQDDYPLGKDLLGGKFDEKNSRKYVKIPEERDITIDVSRPDG